MSTLEMVHPLHSRENTCDDCIYLVDCTIHVIPANHAGEILHWPRLSQHPYGALLKHLHLHRRTSCVRQVASEWSNIEEGVLDAGNGWVTVAPCCWEERERERDLNWTLTGPDLGGHTYRIV